MLVNQFSETEPFVQFANQNQATVGGDVRSLEIDFQQAVETSELAIMRVGGQGAIADTIPGF